MTISEELSRDEAGQCAIRSGVVVGDPLINRLRAAIRYDAQTGAMVWLPWSHERRRAGWWNARYAGTPALSCVAADGYRHGLFERRHLKAHRVVWAIVHGDWPPMIDHINGDRADNRLANLRVAGAVTNGRNQKRRVDNKSGATGVHWNAQRREYEAYIRADGSRRHLGWFKTVAEATAARAAAAADHGYHPNHGARL